MPTIPSRASRPEPNPARRRARRWGPQPVRTSRESQRGQSLVEFSLILTPLLFLLLGIVQFGFVFNSYVTITSAAREAARTGSVYVYDRTITRSANDSARNNQMKSQLLASLNGLSTTSPNLANGSTWTSTTSGTTVTFTNGDIRITYVLPSTVTDNDPRQGYRITVRATYHQDLFVPIVSNFLPHDAGGRLPLAGEVTMVVN